MITKDDLDAAIAECYGQRNPNADTCAKLASYYTIKDKLYPEQSMPQIQPAYSYAPPPTAENVIELDSGTEFSDALKGIKPADAWAKMDELMEALFALNPPLYRRVMRDLNAM